MSIYSVVRKYTESQAFHWLYYFGSLTFTYLGGGTAYLQTERKQEDDPEQTDEIDLDWPSQSHDLNPADNVFHLLRTRLQEKSCQIKQEVKMAAVTAAKELPFEMLDNEDLSFTVHP